MKKIIIATMAVTALISTASFADESYVTGGFEASGHVVAGAGWQRYKVPTAANTSIARDINGTTPGVIGNYAAPPGAAPVALWRDWPRPPRDGAPLRVERPGCVA